MNTQEFAEWLRKEIAHDYKMLLEGKQPYERQWHLGCVAGLQIALAHLESLDSSHDLPSTKG